MSNTIQTIDRLWQLQANYSGVFQVKIDIRPYPNKAVVQAVLSAGFLHDIELMLVYDSFGIFNQGSKIVVGCKVVYDRDGTVVITKKSREELESLGIDQHYKRVERECYIDAIYDLIDIVENKHYDPSEELTYEKD